jgi:hypothetical protein
MGSREREPVGPSQTNRWRTRLARQLSRWSEALAPSSEAAAPTAAASAGPAPAAGAAPAPTSAARLQPRPPRSQLLSPRAASNRLPGVREPLSVEQAVRSRDLTVLRREAADALAALGAAHALVASARFTQLQELRRDMEQGQASEADLATVAADYLGWQSDQVRLFDALTMLLMMRVPPAVALDLIDPAVRQAAEAHLATLTVEYQRRLLDHQFGSETAATEGGA